jgi:hypothetical protein
MTSQNKNFFPTLLGLVLGLWVAESCTFPTPEKKKEAARIKHNYIVLVDLSDRLIVQDNQPERDKQIIKNLYSIFEEKVRHDLYIKSGDEIKVVLAPQLGAGLNRNVFEDRLYVNMGNLDKVSRKAKEEERRNNFYANLDTLYREAVFSYQPNDYHGADIWKYFYEDLKNDYVNDPLTKNYLFILTDGYPIVGHQNKLLQVRNEFPDLEIVLLEAAPREKDLEWDNIMNTWEGWFNSMGVKKYTLVKRSSITKELEQIREIVEWRQEKTASAKASLIHQKKEVGSAVKTTPTHSELYEQYKNEKRYALVIGNSNYKHGAALRNPVNDAADMGMALESLHFDVVTLTDATYIEIRTAFLQLHQKLLDGPKDQTVGLVYYSGHGLQHDGENYLIPVDAHIEYEDDIPRQCFPVQRIILSNMERSNSRMNILILDACRNNTFPRMTRSTQDGLAEMKIGKGSFIAYATAPGSTASDGMGSNGLYTQELLKAMEKPGLTIEQVFKEVRINVLRLSGEQQYTWDSSNITGEFYFNLGAPVVEQAANASGN